MEGNYLTSGDLALWEQRGYGDGRHSCKGMASTGIGLAAGLGGGALLLAIAGLWGVNQASKARSEGALALANANSYRLTGIDNAILAERSSREAWQNSNQPSIQSYIDVQATPQQTTTATAAAEALAYAQAVNNNSLNSAVASSNYLRVQPISVKDCGCCNG